MSFVITRVDNGEGLLSFYYEEVDPDTGRTTSRTPTQPHAYRLYEMLTAALRGQEDAEENLVLAERETSRIKAHLVSEQARLRTHIETERAYRSQLENLTAALLAALPVEMSDVATKMIEESGYVPTTTSPLRPENAADAAEEARTRSPEYAGAPGTREER